MKKFTEKDILEAVLAKEISLKEAEALMGDDMGAEDQTMPLNRGVGGVNIEVLESYEQGVQLGKGTVGWDPVNPKDGERYWDDYAQQGYKFAIISSNGKPVALVGSGPGDTKIISAGGEIVTLVGE